MTSRQHTYDSFMTGTNPVTLAKMTLFSENEKSEKNFFGKCQKMPKK